MAEKRSARPGSLTARENEVARRIALGDSNRDIAAHLHISPRTVEHHIASIFTKLHARSRVQVAMRVRSAQNE